MKRRIDGDEWYPVYSLLDHDPYAALPVGEFTDEEVADYERVFAEFHAWQARLSALYERGQATP